MPRKYVFLSCCQVVLELSSVKRIYDNVTRNSSVQPRHVRYVYTNDQRNSTRLTVDRMRAAARCVEINCLFRTFFVDALCVTHKGHLPCSHSQVMLAVYGMRICTTVVSKRRLSGPVRNQTIPSLYHGLCRDAERATAVVGCNAWWKRVNSFPSVKHHVVCSNRKHVRIRVDVESQFPRT